MLKHLGGLGPKRVQNDTKTNCLEHLGGIGSEIITKMISKLLTMEHLDGLGTEMLQNNT